MKGFKAFDKGMVCRGKQYAENSTFEEAGAETCCREGMMHFCETPFDCLDYYPLVGNNGELIEVAEVEALDKVVCEDNKRASKKIKIGAKLSFRDFIKLGIQCIIESTKPSSSGDYAQIGSSGSGAKIGSSGYCAKIGSSGSGAKIGSSGSGAKIGSSGYCAQIGSSGYCAQIGSSGSGAQIGSSGDYAQIGSSGSGAKIGSSGYCAQIGSSGNYAQIGSSGDRAVVSAIGINRMIKANTGSWITLAEYDEERKPICVKSAMIDGENLLPDVFYTLKNGEFVPIPD